MIPKTRRAFSRRRYKITKLPKTGTIRKVTKLWTWLKINSGASVLSLNSPNQISSGLVKKLFIVTTTRTQHLRRFEFSHQWLLSSLRVPTGLTTTCLWSLSLSTKCQLSSWMVQKTQISSNLKSPLQFSALSLMSNHRWRSWSQTASTLLITCLTAAVMRRTRRRPLHRTTLSSHLRLIIHFQSHFKKRFYPRKTSKF